MVDDKRQAVPEHSQVPRMRSTSEVAEMIHTGTSFTGMLYRLMQKADSKNWTILRKAFPQEAREFVNWMNNGRSGS